MRTKFRRGIDVSGISAAIFLTLGACSTPSHMQVTKGLDPINQDEDVRFRTTYYFRTYDVCEDRKNSQTPRNDSLYRFRLTGKASSLFNDVHFESGSLDASQIDPLGAAVAYDEDNRQFYFKSQERVRRDALRNDQYEEFERLVRLYRDLAESTGGSVPENLENAYLAQIQQALTNQLTAIEGPGLSAEESRGIRLKQLFDRIRAHLRLEQDDEQTGIDPDTNSLLPASSENVVTMIKTVTDPKAKEGFQTQHQSIMEVPGDENYCNSLRRGFQVLGPQGWQPYDQDSRLLFAMSSTGAPLISTLRELSGRILNAKSDPDIDHLTLLVKEELVAQDASDEIDAFEYDPAKPNSADGLLERTLSDLKDGAGQ